MIMYWKYHRGLFWKTNHESGACRDGSHHWEVGQELVVIDTEEGVLLKPARPFPVATLDELAGCLSYSGQDKSLEEMKQSVTVFP
jgi:hypothetical protein